MPNQKLNQCPHTHFVQCAALIVLENQQWKSHIAMTDNDLSTVPTSQEVLEIDRAMLILWALHDDDGADLAPTETRPYDLLIGSSAVPAKRAKYTLLYWCTNHVASAATSELALLYILGILFNILHSNCMIAALKYCNVYMPAYKHHVKYKTVSISTG